MRECGLCGDESTAADALGVCPPCLRERPEAAEPFIRKAHRRARRAFGLVAVAPRSVNGRPCGLCANQCRLTEGEVGYCGVRRNEGGRIVGGRERADVDWYYDPLPTNCVGAPWCDACARGSQLTARLRLAGRPKNLAVFYRACTFDCLFCQNWHFRERAPAARRRTADELAGGVDADTACICYFGGDPTPHAFHALDAAAVARQKRPGRPPRVCWETNGAMAATIAHRMMQASLDSGGCVKFDLKAWSPGVHRALCGAPSDWTRRNFRALAETAREADTKPALVASTLMVPGYVDAEEVSHIAMFIADCDPATPYALLAFHPAFLLSDLPVTPRGQAARCLEAARNAGLTNVRLGNAHLLGLTA